MTSEVSIFLANDFSTYVEIKIVQLPNNNGDEWLEPSLQIKFSDIECGSIHEKKFLIPKNKLLELKRMFFMMGRFLDNEL